MPLTTFLPIFKAYFNITTEPIFVVSGTRLDEFITANGGIISGSDPDYAGKILHYTYDPGNFDNSVTSTHKWAQPFAGLFNTDIYISLVMYENNGIDPENIKLRVTNASISTSYGYPGIVAPPPPPPPDPDPEPSE